MIIKTKDTKSTKLACDALSEGKLVVFPTETCYGIAADSTSKEAITKLLAYKGDRHRQVSIAVADKLMATQYVSLNNIADNLYHNFLPGPVTVISASLHKTDVRLESAEGTLGIRIPAYPYTLGLLQQYGRAITATSANTSGAKEPYSLADWQKYTSTAKQKMVSLFLDAGKLVERPTSTVVDTTLNDPTVLRQGEILLPSSSPIYCSTSQLDTIAFATGLISRHLNLLHKYPLIIALQGNLGAGKTVFSKGIAGALGITDTVASPTYTLLREYPFDLPKYKGVFYHLDTWRLSNMAEVETSLHLSSLLNPGNILALEWAGKAKNWLKKYKELYPILLIDIEEKDENTRQIKYSLTTPEWS